MILRDLLMMTFLFALQLIYSFHFRIINIKFRTNMEQQQSVFKNLLNDDSLFYSEHFFCQAGETALKACATEGCIHPAVLCSNKLCICQKQQHNNCDKYIQLKEFIYQIQEQRMEIPTNIKICFEEIIEKFDVAIQKLSQDRLQFIDYTRMYGFNEQMIEFLTLLNNDNSKQINGGLIYNANNYMDNQQKIYSPIQLNNYQIIRDLLTQIPSLLSKVSYELAPTNKKIQKIKLAFGREQFNCKSLEKNYKNWDFIPVEIENFLELTILDLGNNNITNIKSIQNLLSLQVLDVTNNKINKIKYFEKLINLQRLIFKSNKISKIQNLQNLTHLKQLNLSCNRIKKIQNIDALQSLHLLDLRANYIIKIENLNNLTKLCILYLWNNNIQIIQNLQNLVNLQVLTLKNNPLKVTQYGVNLFKQMLTKKLKTLHLPEQWAIFINPNQKIFTK